jgi:hypothetical protein
LSPQEFKAILDNIARPHPNNNNNNEEKQEEEEEEKEKERRRRRRKKGGGGGGGKEGEKEMKDCCLLFKIKPDEEGFLRGPEARRDGC